MSKNEAIVPVKAPPGTALAKPAKARKEILPPKRRCWLSVRKRSQTFRQSGDFDIDFHEIKSIDLSEECLAKHEHSIGFDSFKFITAFMVLCGVVASTAFTDSWLICFALVALYSASMVYGMNYLEKYVKQRRRAKLIDGRQMEKEQFDIGFERMAKLARGEIDEIEWLPVETVFLGLEHDDAHTREVAAELSQRMPPQIIEQALARYNGELTIETMQGLPRKQRIDYDTALLAGFGRNPSAKDPAYLNPGAAALEWKLRDDDYDEQK